MREALLLIKKKLVNAIAGVAKFAEEFKEKQMERGKFGRSLFMENGEPTSLCCMFLALYLQDKLVKDLKEI